MKKSIIAVAAVTTTIALGTAGVASASTTTKTTKVSVSTSSHTVGLPNNGVDPIASVLATLVSKGTITAAQSKAITDALAAARPSVGQGAPNGQGGPAGQGGAGAPGFGGPRGGFGGFGGFGGGVLGQDQSIILSTLGITAATLQSDLAAGKSLATIAGTQTQALINAIVAAETTAINAQVTAGKLTQAQATTMISGLNARVTAEVNEVPGAGMGGHARGPLGAGPNGAAPAPSASPSN